MRRHVAPLILIALVALLPAGCGRRTAQDPQARIEAEFQKCGAAETMARARDRVKTSPTAENYDLLGRAFAKLKQREPARAALDKAVSLDPTYAPAALLLAHLLLLEDKGEEAEKLARGVLQRDERNTEAIEVLARILSQTNRLAEAEPMLAAAVKKHPKHTGVIWAYADVLAVSRRWDEAEAQYQRALKLDPKASEIRMAYLRMLTFAQRYEGAAGQARELVKQAPNSAAIRWQAAMALQQAGQVDEALAQYREILIIQPGHVKAANNLALTLADRGQDTATAVAWARKAAAAAPREPLIVDTLGWALVRDGRVSEGLPLLQGVHKALPNNEPIQYHLGWTLVKSGKKAEGLKLLQQAAGGKDTLTAEQARKALADLR